MATSKNGDGGQLNAVDQAKRDYDKAMDVVREVAAELADAGERGDADSSEICAMAAVGQLAATTALAAATRLRAEYAAEAGE